ncbi:MAG: phosphate ABC transporter permease subunit PstC [Aquisalimonadaceae bacterium]
MSTCRTDTLAGRFLLVPVLFVAMLTLWIVVFLSVESWPALSSIGTGFLSSDQGWYPASGEYNLWPMVLATLALGAGSLAIALVFGVAIAVFSCYYAPRWLSRAVSTVLELLAGIPTVIYGLWGLVFLVPAIASIGGPGASLLAGIVVLSMMILPTVAVLSEQALRQVPSQYHIAGLSLGLRKTTIVFSILLRVARPSIISAALLAFARAVGETMVVLMVCGNAVNVPDSLLISVRALTANIALEMPYAMDAHRAALYVSGLLLIVMVIVLVAINHMQHWSRRDA